MCVHCCMYVVYFRAYVVFVYRYVYSCARSFFVRKQRLAAARFCSLHTWEPFFDHSCRMPFSFSCAVPFSHAFAVFPFAVSVGLCPVFMRARLPFLCSKRLQGSFQKVLSRFKRSKFSACTFVHFAPFHAVTEPQTWQKRRYAG